MSFRHRELGYLVRFKKPEAERIIREAYSDAGGLLEQAAIDLGVSSRTLQRYVRQLGIWSKADRCLIEDHSEDDSSLPEVPVDALFDPVE